MNRRTADCLSHCDQGAVAMTSFNGAAAEESDPRFARDSIGQHMRVPDRLTMQSRPQPGSALWTEQRHEEEEAQPPAYSMTVPDRLRYTEAPDMSPRPMFGPSSKAPITYWSAPPLDHSWEGPTAPPPDEDPPQSPLRRSYSDQAFVPPSHHKQALLHHGHTPRGSSSSSLHHRSAPPTSPMAPPPPPPSLLSPHTVLQAARELGQHASQRLLQAIGHKYRSSPVSPLTPVGSSLVQVEHSRKSGQTDSWSLDDEGGAAVEFIVLRRQVVKISRRLAGLERQNAERRNSEVVLFSLLLSTCLLNAWLWIRR